LLASNSSQCDEKDKRGRKKERDVSSACAIEREKTGKRNVYVDVMCDVIFNVYCGCRFCGVGVMCVALCSLQGPHKSRTRKTRKGGHTRRRRGGQGMPHIRSYM
jgi:hypothetical protein